MAYTAEDYIQEVKEWEEKYGTLIYRWDNDEYHREQE